MDTQDFCRRLPKVELHAHLNGSLSMNTLQKLYKMQDSDIVLSDQAFMSTANFSSLSECFKVFDIAHALTVTPQAVFTATCDVIREFYEDNVIYLELRSTPRTVKDSMTKTEYLEAMIKAFETSKSQFPQILVKLLISINRKQGYESAKENINLAIQFVKKYPEYIVGIDLSGDPTVNYSFLELLEISRKAGLKIAAHCAEVPNEMETIDILKFKPNRLGHCTCIHPRLQGSKQLFDMLLESKIPVELCLTSNVKCKTVPSYEFHQFKYLYEVGHPITIGTDDKGVFNTCLSKELQLLSSVFNIGKEQLKKLSLLSVQYSFANAEERKKSMRSMPMKMFCHARRKEKEADKKKNISRSDESSRWLGLIVCEFDGYINPGSRMGNFTIYLLRAQSERGGSDARWQPKTFNDLLPQLLVDHFDQTTSRDH